MVMGGLCGWSGRHHRLPGSFLIAITPYMKKVLAPLREQGQKIHFCGTTLLAGNLPLCPVPTHRLPVNAGNASEDTGITIRSHCPLRPICCPAFRSALSHRNSLWMRLAALLPLPWFQTMLCSLYTICVRLSRTFLRRRWTTQYSRTTALTMPMIWA